MKRLYYFDKFKMLLEAENDTESDFETEFDVTGDEAENTEGNIEGNTEGNTEEQTDDEPKEVYNETPEYYIEEALKTLERKLSQLFVDSEVSDDKTKKVDPSTYAAQKLVLDQTHITGLPLAKTLIMDYSDTENNFKYKLMVTINLDEAIPSKKDVDMNTEMIKNCGVKFKKYKNETEYIGELDRNKVDINTINQDYLDGLNIELDKKYSVDNNLEIEYEDES